MTQDEIIEVAVKAGIAQVVAEVNIDILEAFANFIAAKEREACAKVCDDDINGFDGAFYLANKIRARGEA